MSTSINYFTRILITGAIAFLVFFLVLQLVILILLLRIIITVLVIAVVEVLVLVKVVFELAGHHCRSWYYRQFCSIRISIYIRRCITRIDSSLYPCCSLIYTCVTSRLRGRIAFFQVASSVAIRQCVYAVIVAICVAVPPFLSCLVKPA